MPARFRDRLSRWERTVTNAGASGWRTLLDASKLPGVLESVRS